MKFNKGYKMKDSKYDYTYRIDLQVEYLELLQKYINQIDNVDERDTIMLNEIKEMINNPKKIKRSVNKMIACDKATEARTKKAKEKIQNAVNILRMQGKKITYYSISKESGVAYQTVKKYLKM